MAKAAHIGAVKIGAMSRRTATRGTKRVRHDREGRKAIQAFVDDSIAIAFKVVAAENLKTDSAMIHEAVGLLLQSYGKEIPADLQGRLIDEGLYDHFAAAISAKTPAPD